MQTKHTNTEFVFLLPYTNKHLNLYTETFFDEFDIHDATTYVSYEESFNEERETNKEIVTDDAVVPITDVTDTTLEEPIQDAEQVFEQDSEQVSEQDSNEVKNTDNLEEEEQDLEQEEQDDDDLEYSDNTEEEEEEHDSDDSDTETLEDEDEDDVQYENKEKEEEEEDSEEVKPDENMFTTSNNTQPGGNKEEIIKMPYNFFYNKMKYLSDAYKKYRSSDTTQPLGETDSSSVNETPNVITITIPKVGNVERVTIDTIGYNPSQWRIVQYLLKHDVKWLDMEVWEMDDNWIAIGAITNKSGRPIPIDPKLSNTLLIKQIIESEEE